MTRDQLLNVCRLLGVDDVVVGLVFLAAKADREGDNVFATVPGRVSVFSEALASGAVTPEEVSEALHRARVMLAEGAAVPAGLSATEATVVLSQALTGFDRAA